MIEPCEHCGSERIAAVLWKKIEQSPRAGNKYRLRCLDCGRWLPCCSKGEFQTADRQHVLPADVDPDSETPTVPVGDYDGPVDGLREPPTGEPEDGMAADGSGGTVDDDDDAGQEHDDGDDEPVNEFQCPPSHGGCGKTVTGYPDECPHCGAGYDWKNEERETQREDT